MKKVISFLLTAAMLLSLPGCFQQNQMPGEPAVSESVSPTQPSNSPEVSNGPSDLFQNYESLDDYYAPDDALRVKENILLDEGGLTIKALWVDPDPAELLDGQTEPGPQLELLVTNKTGEFLVLWVDKATINGYTVYAPFCEYTSDGTEERYTVPFNCSDLLEAGLTDIAEVGLAFSVYDFDDFGDEALPIMTTDLVYVETELANGWTDSVNTEGTLIYEDENFTIKVLGATTKVIEYNNGNYNNPDWTRVEGGALSLYLENRSGYPVWFQVWSSVINDTVLALYLPDECQMLWPNAKTVTHADMHFRDIEEYGIVDICDATVSFAVYRCQGEEPDIWTDEQLLTTEKVGMSFNGAQ